MRRNGESQGLGEFGLIGREGNNAYKVAQIGDELWNFGLELGGTVTKHGTQGGRFELCCWKLTGCFDLR